MSDDGYTLMEVLVALGILSLAMGGLVDSAKVLGDFQREAVRLTATSKAEANIQRRLDDLLAGQGPFLANRMGGFSGGPTELGFACGSGRCEAELDRTSAGGILSTTGQAPAMLPGSTLEFRFAYDGGEGASWPSAPDQAAPLRSVSLVDRARGERPIATTLVVIEEPPACVFDLVAQGCRAGP